ncbi:MAG: hypothetical protein CV089_08510 [Nitrospira sp. WS110]|nr:hypothetical protein [Nitrospira sp. WS110]
MPLWFQGGAIRFGGEDRLRIRISSSGTSGGEPAAPVRIREDRTAGILEVYLRIDRRSPSIRIRGSG